MPPALRVPARLRFLWRASSFPLSDKLRSELPELPDGFAIVGGAAREALRLELGLRSEGVRDLDIVRLPGVPRHAHEGRMNERFNPVDAAQGYGIREISSGYFHERDFGMNEALIIGDRVHATVRAVEHLSNHMLVPSRNYSGRGALCSILTAKALRFISTYRTVLDESWTLDVPALPARIEPFHIALHLDRALERSLAAGLSFCSLLFDFGYLERPVTSRDDLRSLLLELPDRSRLGAGMYESHAARTLVAELKPRSLETGRVSSTRSDRVRGGRWTYDGPATTTTRPYVPSNLY